jgi:tetratricopeptide (TPR) repeat protein
MYGQGNLVRDQGNIALSDTPGAATSHHTDSADPAATLAQYQEALVAFERNQQMLLPALIARDRADAALRHLAVDSSSSNRVDNEQLLDLQQLLVQIGPGHPSYIHALLYQYRLNENLDQVRRYGDTETLRAERAQVVDHLNRLALAALGLPFHALASAATPTALSDQIIALDRRLRRAAFRHSRALADLPSWRQSLQPPNEAWWWQLDQQFEKQEQENDLPWFVLAAILGTLTITLTVEIIRRLWAAEPDTLAVLVTLVTLLLSSSPLLKHGQELTQWLVRRIPGINPRFRGELVAGTATFAFALVLIVWLCLPFLGIYYNNQGKRALDAGNLNDADQLIERAVALNPDLPVPYFNLAEVYLTSGRPEEAAQWLRRSIERDTRFRPAYHGLGYLYNLQGKFDDAEQILIAGLTITNPTEIQLVRVATDYELLSNLGWTYLEQRRIERAKEALEKAVSLESILAEQYHLALPHYYLAQVYCRLDSSHATLAEEQWRDTIRYLDPSSWAHKDWYDTANAHLDAVKRSASPCDAPSL